MKKKIKSALISVSDKDKLSSILKVLKKFNIRIISSGGTYKKIKKLGYKCIEVSEYTGVPEILNGRVKTLNPKIYAGILSNRNKSHNIQMRKLNFEEIDLLIVNFYPFNKILETTKNPKKIIENIDIGGPSMARAGAKNFENVTVISSVRNYEMLRNELLKNNGCTTLYFRKEMADETFLNTCFYDSSISKYFNKISNNNFPDNKIISGEKYEDLRYGENPHQRAAIYLTDKDKQIIKLSGKKLSYNNYNDLYSALTISKSMPKNRGTVIIKHSTPCGISIHENKIKSYKMALNCDPVSAYGGIVCCNFKVNKFLALEISKMFIEILAANGFDKEALKILKKRKNLRIINASKVNIDKSISLRSNFNTLLTQTSDNEFFDNRNFKVVSKAKPSKKIFDNLLFAFNACRFVKSNAIVITKDFSTIGIGSGQPSRVDSCEIAVNKMRRFSKDYKNSQIYAASDAFFPFVDGIEKLAQAGVSAIIQPSGSIRDKEIIKFANRLGMILVFSKTRHFRH